MTGLEFINYNKEAIIHNIADNLNCLDWAEFEDVFRKIDTNLIPEKRLNSDLSINVIKEILKKFSNSSIKQGVITDWLIKYLKKDITFIHAYNYLAQKINREVGSVVHKIKLNFDEAEQEIYKLLAKPGQNSIIKEREIENHKQIPFLENLFKERRIPTIIKDYYYNLIPQPGKEKGKFYPPYIILPYFEINLHEVKRPNHKLIMQGFISPQRNLPGEDGLKNIKTYYIFFITSYSKLDELINKKCVIKYCIKLINKFLKCHNYHAAMAVISSLYNYDLYGNKKIWDLRMKKELDECSKIMLPTRSDKYRYKINNLLLEGKSFIPSISIIFRDIILFNESFNVRDDSNDEMQTLESIKVMNEKLFNPFYCAKKNIIHVDKKYEEFNIKYLFFDKLQEDGDELVTNVV